ncbi:DUF128 domain-containing protein [Methanococcus voltae]|uniref:Nitrogen repressor-like protein n=2 Tax=Methanococcus voltae TaxID=2188 RepID=Q58GH9_METVO|nr:DUF128 domain-containing protein [Methanococcus voltae]AAX55776.1 nitrogen repressor-like protein [Methanococcus voltae PS]MBP2173138.1 repressor of nif and glnA expression [Methanococcus voltae]MBP2202070.1 repressor of nif and glnA expression [Methanococcus voltae]MCS3922841.1 repressor of nif and glnA expression [Methanococcus voltae PS]
MTKNLNIAILNLLSKYDKPIGAKIIAEDLKLRGYEIGERAVRYHLQSMDDEELTKRVGYSGRIITEKGTEELQKANVAHRIGSVSANIYDKIIKNNYPETIIINTGIFDLEGSLNNTNDINLGNKTVDKLKDLILSSFMKGFSTGNYLKMEGLTNEITNNISKLKVETLCNVNFDNYLIKNGIMPMPKHGGVVKYEDGEPVNFKGVIEFKKSSVDPLIAFIMQKKTDVLGVMENGEGYIPANFRVIPKSKLNDFKQLLKKDDLKSVICYGENNILGINLNDEEIGVALIGGLTPLCPPVELGYALEINPSTNIIDNPKIPVPKENIIEPIEVTDDFLNKYKFKNYGKPTTKGYDICNIEDLKRLNVLKDYNVKPVLSKMISMMHEVKFDIKNESGQIIVNMAKIDLNQLNKLENEKNEEDVLKLLKEVYKKDLSISNKLKIEEDVKNGFLNIYTICSLTFDGILLNNQIPVLPYYGGLLERPEMRFIEAISYEGTSLDPHEVFFDKSDGKTTLLAGIRKVPMFSKSKIEEIYDDLGWNSILEYGKPNNDLCGIRVESEMLGYVTLGGTNPFAYLNVNKIPVKIETHYRIMDYSELDDYDLIL